MGRFVTTRFERNTALQRPYDIVSEGLQHCSNIALLCCAKYRCYESSRVDPGEEVV